jgi:hypothetical protein
MFTEFQGVMEKIRKRGREKDGKYIKRKEAKT